MKKNAITFTLIITVFCVVLMTISGCNKEYTDEENIDYITSNLKSDFKTEFDFIGQEYDTENSRMLYYFSPKDNSNLKVTTYCGVSSDAGMVNTIIPFEIHRWYHNDFSDVLEQSVISELDCEVIDLTKLNRQEANEKIYNLLFKIQEVLKQYNIYYFDGIDLKVYDGSEIKEQIFCLNKNYIDDRLDEVWPKE